MDFFPLIKDATTSPSLHTFPIEVMEGIIDQARDDPPSLKRFSLSSKLLLTRARYHLFTTIVIRDVERMESSREFLDSHPWILPLVRKVTLSIHLSHKDTNLKPNIPLLDTIRLHLFTRLPNLRAWGMNTTSMGPHDSTWLSFHRVPLLCYRIYSRRVQSLEPSGIRLQDVSHFIQLISAFTSLRHMSCSKLWLRRKERRSTSQRNPEIVNKFAKPLKLYDISIDTSVDIRLVECLLDSSAAALESLAITLTDTVGCAKNGDTYFTRLIASTSRLTHMLSLTFTIPCGWPGREVDNNLALSPTQQMHWATRILKHLGRARPIDVHVELELDTIATIGLFLTSGDVDYSPDCKALETVLLTLPASNLNIQFCRSDHGLRRAGRPEFWSPIIRSAFSELHERGLLTLPYTRPSDLFGHEGRVTHLLASPDSRWIATASDDGTVILWDPECGKVVRDWLADRNAIKALAFSPDGERLVCSGGMFNEVLTVWELIDLRVDASRDVPKVASIYVDSDADNKPILVACAWSPNGALMAAASFEGLVRVWDAWRFELCCVFTDDGPDTDSCFSNPKFLQWSPDSSYLAWSYEIFGRYDTMARYGLAVWSALTPEKPPKGLPSHPAHPKPLQMHALAFDPKSTRVATAVSVLQTADLDNGVSGGTVEGDKQSTDRDSVCIHVWDIVTDALLAVLGHASTTILDVSFSPDGGSLLSVSECGLVRIWDTETWQETASGWLGGYGSPFSTACFSPDRRHIATATSNEPGSTNAFMVQLWRVCEASCAAVFTGHMGQIHHLAFSPDGEFLASGDRFGIVRIHRLSNFI